MNLKKRKIFPTCDSGSIIQAEGRTWDKVAKVSETLEHACLASLHGIYMGKEAQ